MKCLFLSFLFLSFSFSRSFSQGPLLKAGSAFPPVLISNISNAPVKEWNAYKNKDGKYYILNFWGTWCSPCIPEMDNLSKLQAANKDRLQVIGISDDNEERKQKFLKRAPSTIWLATDTSYTLYDMLQLANVGQCIVLNPKREIVAILNTDSVNQALLDRVLRGEQIASSGKIKEAALNTADVFGVDSLTSHSFSVRGYVTGQPTMMRRYYEGPFAGRRMTWMNVTATNVYREAYQIKTIQQEVYDSSVSKKELNEFEDKSKRICVDLLVRPEEKDSLYVILQRLLPAYLPAKVRQETRMMPVYALTQKATGSFTLPLSTATASTFGFSGRGFEGTKVTLADFAAIYLSNEMGLPVVDETGLNGSYDIKTVVNLRTREEVMKSVESLGLRLEKTERRMPVIVYYK